MVTLENKKSTPSRTLLSFEGGGPAACRRYEGRADDLSASLEKEKMRWRRINDWQEISGPNWLANNRLVNPPMGIVPMIDCSFVYRATDNATAMRPTFLSTHQVGHGTCC